MGSRTVCDFLLLDVPCSNIGGRQTVVVVSTIADMTMRFPDWKKSHVKLPLRTRQKTILESVVCTLAAYIRPRELFLGQLGKK